MPNVGIDSEETAEESQTETETDEVEEEEGKENADVGKDGKPIPFHKHPRWIERERQNDEKMRKAIEEVKQATSSEIATLKAQIETRKEERKELTDEDIPEWFNGDLAMYKKYDESQTKRIQEAVKAAEEGAVKRIDGRATQETKAVEEATTYFRSQVTAIEADPELNPSGEPIDQKRLMEIARDNDLVDSHRRWNWKAAARILARETSNGDGGEEAEEQKKIKTQKKNIAAITSRRDSKGGATHKAIASSDSIGKKGWDDL